MHAAGRLQIARSHRNPPVQNGSIERLTACLPASRLVSRFQLRFLYLLSCPNAQVSACWLGEKPLNGQFQGGLLSVSVPGVNAFALMNTEEGMEMPSALRAGN